MSNNYNNSNLKRLFDIIFGLLGIIILILLLPVIFFIVKLDTNGPVFYKRDRLGINGKRFQLVKLRTMSVKSSLTPGIVENSCTTPLNLIEVIAAPCKEDSNILQSELPSGNPNPLSKGSAISIPNLSVFS